jgi:hypothetical protein
VNKRTDTTSEEIHLTGELGVGEGGGALTRVSHKLDTINAGSTWITENVYYETEFTRAFHFKPLSSSEEGKQAYEITSLSFSNSLPIITKSGMNVASRRRPNVNFFRSYSHL